MPREQNKSPIEPAFRRNDWKETTTTLTLPSPLKGEGKRRAPLAPPPVSWISMDNEGDTSHGEKRKVFSGRDDF